MNKDLRELLAGYVDGELSAEQREAFEKELAANPELRAELEQFKKLKEVTSLMTYADLPEEVWENYWASLYRKLERGLGWILGSIGAIILFVYAAFEVLKNLFLDSGVPILVKIGVGAVVVGAIILLVSYARERVFAYRRERYREVTR